jgi:hypothetical protein
MQIFQEAEYFILSKRAREIRHVYLLYQAVSTYNIFLLDVWRIFISEFIRV